MEPNYNIVDCVIGAVDPQIYRKLTWTTQIRTEYKTIPVVLCERRKILAIILRFGPFFGSRSDRDGHGQHRGQHVWRDSPAPATEGHPDSSNNKYDINEIRKTLRKHGQTHLLKYYDQKQLSAEEGEYLLAQVRASSGVDE